MKNIILMVKLMLLAALFATSTRAANVIVYDSVESLATNTTKHYTFVDPATSQSVIIAVTMTAYSPSDPSATFSVIDSGTRLGVDGNIINAGAGANFSASLISASSGVEAGTVAFGIAGLGIRPVDGGGTANWASSASAVAISFSNTTEVVETLDTTTASLNGVNYSGQLLFPGNAYFQLTDAGALAGQSVALNATFVTTGSLADPQLTTWVTAYAGKYARIYTNDLARTNGVTETTWTNPVQTYLAQALPTYAGVQEVAYSSNWIYMRTPDFPNYIMGPWYNDSTRTSTFLNSPTNQHVLYVLPRTATLTSPPAAKTTTFGPIDAIGYFVNGVAMFDALDGFQWNGTADAMGGNYQWHRAAYPNEGPTFDPSYSHQQNTGEYHNHADPIGVRYAVGDHVDFNPVTKIYTESTSAPTQHSPILGWVRDGYPIYGPYGYANPTNANSGIRRMISGYQLRNGDNGSDNITNVGRGNLPAWTLRNNGNITQTGPPVGSSYPAGRYLQDYAYLGDLTNAVTGTNYQFGVDFDLNEFDCRWCFTPEFPGGTYAYFVTIDSNGVPIAPWNVGMYFFGNATGYKGTNITETVTTNFTGAPNIHPILNPPTANNGIVTLAWSATEGGTYLVESTTNFTSWTTNSTTVFAVLNGASYTNNSTSSDRFYRVAQIALANYDPVGSVTNSGGGGGGTATITMSPPFGNRNTTNTVTATISASATPPVPPQSGAPVQSFKVGSLSVTGSSYTYSSGQGIVTGTLVIPSGATTGSQTVVITFSPPQGQTNGPSYTQTGGFTIN